MLQSFVAFWISAEKVSAPLAELGLSVGVVALNGFPKPEWDSNANLTY